jgi:hypothetical protein
MAWLLSVGAGDEWLITYAIPPLLRSVKSFAAGHAVELYLKAAVEKLTGNVEHAANFGHRIDKLWAECKRRDSQFMPQYEIRDSVLHADLFSGCDLTKEFNPTDLESYFQHLELYTVAKLLPDLKYDGLPMRRHSGPYARAWIYPNPYWTRFFREFRKFLKFPEAGHRDTIAEHIRDGSLPPAAVAFLRGLYVKEPNTP